MESRRAVSSFRGFERRSSRWRSVLPSHWRRRPAPTRKAHPHGLARTPRRPPPPTLRHRCRRGPLPPMRSMYGPALLSIGRTRCGSTTGTVRASLRRPSMAVGMVPTAHPSPRWAISEPLAVSNWGSDMSRRRSCGLKPPSSTARMLRSRVAPTFSKTRDGRRFTRVFPPGAQGIDSQQRPPP